MDAVCATPPCLKAAQSKLRSQDSIRNYYKVEILEYVDDRYLHGLCTLHHILIQDICTCTIVSVFDIRKFVFYKNVKALS